MGTLMPRRDGLFPTREDFLFPIEQHFNKFFDEFFKSTKDAAGLVSASAGFPRMNIVERPDCLEIKASVAGWDEGDIHVELSPDNVVTISGTKTSGEATCNSTYHLRELRQSNFSRSVKLPDYVKGDPEAVLRNGILTLVWSINHKETEPKSRRIEIKKNWDVHPAPE